MKRIQKAGGRVGWDGRVNHDLNLSRAIGDHRLKKNGNLSLQKQMISAMPDIHSTTIHTGDNFLLLGCDGIFEVLTNQEAIDFVQSRLDKVNLSKDGPGALARICEELCDRCLANNTSTSIYGKDT